MGSTRAIVLYIAMSLDGYIADQHGGIDWLAEFDDEAVRSYNDFSPTIDTIIMGRVTYEQLLTFPEWPYAGKRCYVFTHRQHPADERVTFVHDDVTDFVHRLKGEAGSHIWLLGGAAILDAFLKARLVDEFIITVVPIMLGDGIALFKPGNPTVRLSLRALRQRGELVELQYTVPTP